MQPLEKLVQALTTIPFNQMLGLQLDHIDESQVTLSFQMKQELVGNYLHGILHGGVISSVLDMAGGMMAMASVMRKNKGTTLENLAEVVGKCSTADLQISFLNPGRGNRFIANAWRVKMGNKLCFTRMELHNEAENMLAMGQGTYLIA